MLEAFLCTRKSSRGLVYTSESEDKPEAFLWEDGGKLTPKHLLELAGAKAGTAVEESSLHRRQDQRRPLGRAQDHRRRNLAEPFVAVGNNGEMVQTADLDSPAQGSPRSSYGLVSGIG
jgi:hypothetical protein